MKKTINVKSTKNFIKITYFNIYTLKTKEKNLTKIKLKVLKI